MTSLCLHGKRLYCFKVLLCFLFLDCRDEATAR